MRRIVYTVPFGDGLPIFGYGLFLMLGFVIGLFVACRRAKRAGISTDVTLDVGIIAIFAGVIGARLAYLLIDYHPVDGDYGTWKEWIAVWQGGLTFQGGLFLALLADFVYLRWRNVSIGRMFDVYAPSLALGVGFGRIGCLLNGCCWGKPAPAGSLLAMTFPDDTEVTALQHWMHQVNPDEWVRMVTGLGHDAGILPPVPVYATQIISALGLFLIAAGLIWAERRWPRRADGQVIVWFMFAYGIGRFLIEFWRDDTPLRYGFGAFPGLRLGQWLAVAMIAVGIVMQLCLKRDNNKGGDSHEDMPEPHS